MVEEERHPEDWVPSTEADRKAIFGQLDRLLESPLFRNSKRYPNMLRYVVEQALEGNEALLKERLLGIAVFQRSPDYDTNQDTVVRLTAGEVRKRIAQYYHQPEHAGELQIDLKPGSYVPVFRRPEPQPSANGGEKHLLYELAQRTENAAKIPARKAPSEEPEQTKLHAEPPPRQEEQARTEPDNSPVAAGTSGEMPRQFVKNRRSSLLRLLAGSMVLLAVAGGVLFWWVSGESRQTPDHQLWAPILQESGQIQLVVADLSAATLNNSQNSSQVQQRRQAGALIDLLRMGEIVNYRDSLAQTDLVAFLSRHGKPYRLELSSQASYSDLQRSASVLVGGLDNVWTLRLTEPLRYHFVHRGPGYNYAIEDRQHPEQAGWSVDLTQPPDHSTQDYAIVARIFDVTTGRPVLVVAGIGANGTTAAAQFLLEPDRMAELTPHAPRKWEHLNMEAVIRTQILDNHAGPPHVVDCYFW